MGGYGHGWITLKEVIEQFESEKKNHPELTENDVIISSGYGYDDHGTSIGIEYKYPPKKKPKTIDDVIRGIEDGKK